MSDIINNIFLHKFPLEIYEQYEYYGKAGDIVRCSQV